MTNLSDIKVEHIRSALCECEPDGFDVHWTYSGRGMYGARCFGVVPRESNSHIELMYRAWVQAVQEQTGGDPDIYDTAEFLAELDREARSDNMGYDSIYYWPDLRLDLPEDFDEEDFDEG